MEEAENPPQPDDPPSWPELITFWKTQDITAPGDSKNNDSSDNHHPFLAANKKSSSAALLPLAPSSRSASPRVYEPAFFVPPTPSTSNSAPATPRDVPPFPASHPPAHQQPRQEAPRKLSLDEKAKAHQLIRTGSEKIRREVPPAKVVERAPVEYRPALRPAVEREDSLESELKQLMTANFLSDGGGPPDKNKKTKKRGRGIRKRSKEDEADEAAPKCGTLTEGSAEIESVFHAEEDGRGSGGRRALWERGKSGKESAKERRKQSGDSKKKDKDKEKKKKEKEKRGRSKSGNNRDDGGEEKEASAEAENKPGRMASIRRLRLFSLRGNSSVDVQAQVSGGSKVTTSQTAKLGLRSSVSSHVHIPIATSSTPSSPSSSPRTSIPMSRSADDKSKLLDYDDENDEEACPSFALAPISSRIPPSGSTRSPTSSSTSIPTATPRGSLSKKMGSMTSLLSSFPSFSAPSSPSSTPPSKRLRVGSQRLSRRGTKEREREKEQCGRDDLVASSSVSCSAEASGLSLQRAISARDPTNSSTVASRDAGEVLDAKAKKLKKHSRSSSVNISAQGSGTPIKKGSAGRRAREMMAIALGMSSAGSIAAVMNEEANAGDPVPQVNPTPAITRRSTRSPTPVAEASSDPPSAAAVGSAAPAAHPPSQLPTVRWHASEPAILFESTNGKRAIDSGRPAQGLPKMTRLPTPGAGLLRSDSFAMTQVIGDKYAKAANPSMYSKLSFESLPGGRRNSIPPAYTPRSENEQLDEPVPDALIDSSPSPSPRLVTPTNSPLSLSGRWFMRRNTDPSSPLPHLRLSNHCVEISRASLGLSSSNTVMEGYLLKRNNRGRWKRRWMVLNNTHFYGFRSPQDPFCSLAIDLMFASAKPLHMASRHGFELITMDKNYAFDVFTREALDSWTSAIQRVCAVLLKKNMASKSGITDTSESDGSWSDSKSGRLALLQMRKEDCNMLCADCNARDPEWVLMELGAFICIECAAVHRRLGSTISQVRSIQLDAWEAQQVEFLKQNGNLKVNQWWEGRRMEGIRKPTQPMVTESEREKYIRLKYEKKFFTKDCPLLSVDEALASEADREKATRMRELKSLILALVRNDDEFRSELKALLLSSAAVVPPRPADPLAALQIAPVEWTGGGPPTDDGQRVVPEVSTSTAGAVPENGTTAAMTMAVVAEPTEEAPPLMRKASTEREKEDHSREMEKEGKEEDDYHTASEREREDCDDEVAAGRRAVDKKGSREEKEAKDGTREREDAPQRKLADGGGDECPKPEDAPALVGAAEKERSASAEGAERERIASAEAERSCDGPAAVVEGRERQTSTDAEPKNKSKKKKKTKKEKKKKEKDREEGKEDTEGKKERRRAKTKAEKVAKQEDREDRDEEHRATKPTKRLKRRRGLTEGAQVRGTTPAGEDHCLGTPIPAKSLLRPGAESVTMVSVMTAPKQFPKLVTHASLSLFAPGTVPEPGFMSARGVGGQNPSHHQNQQQGREAPQSLSKIEAESEREVFRSEKRKVGGDNLVRRMVVDTVSTAAVYGGGKSSGGGKEPRQSDGRRREEPESHNSSLLPSLLLRPMPHAEPTDLAALSGGKLLVRTPSSLSLSLSPPAAAPSLAAARSYSSSSSSSSSSSAAASTKHKKREGTSRRKEATEKDSAATAVAQPPLDAGLVQRMKKMSAGMLSPQRRRARSLAGGDHDP